MPCLSRTDKITRRHFLICVTVVKVNDKKEISSLLFFNTFPSFLSQNTLVLLHRIIRNYESIVYKFNFYLLFEHACTMRMKSLLCSHYLVV